MREGRDHMGRPRVDITGQRFGLLVALEPTGKSNHAGSIWRCACDCGGEREVGLQSLKRGQVKSCGCKSKGQNMHDLTGQRFGKLVALEPTEKRCSGSVIWKCRCDCGAIHEADAGSLKRGLTKSCGDSVHRINMIDLTGQRFGRLVAIEPTEKRKGSSVVWRCRCDCGNSCDVSSYLLRSGNTRSCGCLREKSK